MIKVKKEYLNVLENFSPNGDFDPEISECCWSHLGDKLEKEYYRIVGKKHAGYSVSFDQSDEIYTTLMKSNSLSQAIRFGDQNLYSETSSRYWSYNKVEEWLKEKCKIPNAVPYSYDLEKGTIKIGHLGRD